MTATPWAHLPNAEAISRVIESAKGWRLGTVYARTPEMRDIWDRWLTGVDYTAYEAWDLVKSAVDRAGVVDNWHTLADAVCTLIVHPDSAYILDLHPDVVRLMAASGNEPAIILERAVRAMHGEAI